MSERTNDYLCCYGGGSYLQMDLKKGFFLHKQLLKNVQLNDKYLLKINIYFNTHQFAFFLFCWKNSKQLNDNINLHSYIISP